VLFRREVAFGKMATWQVYIFGLSMAGLSLFMMGAGTLGAPRRHWDITFAGNAFTHEFPGATWLMITLMGLCGLGALLGGAMYLAITVWSVFLAKGIQTPEFKHVPAKQGVAPAPQPVAVTLTSHHGGIGAAGMVAPGTFVLALVFLTSFVLYYFVNWKYLSTVWPLK
jgi:cytochrome c oxidase subunit 1